MKNVKFVKKILIASALGLSGLVSAQNITDDDVLRYNTEGLSDQANPIYTALPFLSIAPDSRGGGLGDNGAATSPDVWSMHWNPSKYAFMDNEMGAGLSYVPWLRNLGVKDINLAYLAGYYKLDKMQTVAGAVRYFSMGDIIFRDEQGTQLGTFAPKEFTFDIAYARLLSDNFSLSIAGRYINSNLTNGYSNDGSDTKPARTVAADLSGYYKNEVKVNGLPSTYSLGFNISNIGAKVGYSESADKDFLPTNLRLGGGFAVDFDAFNNIGLYADVNKLLVPTPPQFDTDGNMYGKDDDVAVVAGIFQSFNDAPGGSKEELHELQYSIGAEYWYDKQFAVRGGYYTEHETKGNRKFFEIGLGLRMNVFGLDFSYLVPTKGQNSPLARTLRFSLTFDFEGLANENTPEDI